MTETNIPLTTSSQATQSQENKQLPKPKKNNNKIYVIILCVLIFIAIGSLTIYQLGIFAPKTNRSPQNTVTPDAPRIGPAPKFQLTMPERFDLGVFATKLGTPRDLQFSPGGTLLVSIPKEGRVVALPDKNQDGVADEVLSVIDGLNKPHGLAFYENKLFIAEETQVSRYIWDEEDLIATQEKILFNLPRGGNHTTRSLVFNKQGQLFVSIGSTCDVCFETHEWLAAVVISNQDGTTPQLFARGLRNAVFLTVNPETDLLWGTEMGRDYLGDTSPPDEINIIGSNRNYGWPICWGDKNHDTVFDKNQYIRDPCVNTESPQYGIPAHSAPLGLTFVNSPQFPKEWQGDLLVAYHGSWNSKTPVGYKIVRMDINGNDVIGEEDFITGFLVAKTEKVVGRPVDLTFDTEGSLYISDDQTGMIYKMIAN